MTAEEWEEIKPVHEEVRIQMKCGGSGGKQERAETAVRENGNAKSVFVLLWPDLKEQEHFESKQHLDCFMLKYLIFLVIWYLTSHFEQQSHSYSLEEHLKDLERICILSSAYVRAAELPQTTQTSITNTSLPTNIRIKYKINPKEHSTAMVPSTDRRLMT